MGTYRCAKCDYEVTTDEKRPRCPTCILDFGEQKGRHVVLYQTDIAVLTSDFLDDAPPTSEPIERCAKWCTECGAQSVVECEAMQEGLRVEQMHDYSPTPPEPIESERCPECKQAVNGEYERGWRDALSWRRAVTANNTKSPKAPTGDGGVDVRGLAEELYMDIRDLFDGAYGGPERAKQGTEMAATALTAMYERGKRERDGKVEAVLGRVADVFEAWHDDECNRAEGPKQRTRALIRGGMLADVVRELRRAQKHGLAAPKEGGSADDE
jgi:hypothetical protein